MYNSDMDFRCPQRLRFSLAHEVGHIILKHTDDNAASEEEANYFASQIVAHDAIAVPMLTGDWEKDKNFIREQFGISWQAAEIKLRQINRNKRAYSYTENLLYAKYRDLFNKQRYSGNKFMINIGVCDIICDEAI